MATMNISLPDQMKAWVEEQAADGKYANSSDYVRDLIRRDQIKREKIAALNAKIDEGYASGFSGKSIDQVMSDAWKAAKRED
jgi:antitoxin ParD1/3/4